MANKAQRSLRSLANPNGIKPTNPPTATFVSPFGAAVKAPIKTIIKPMNITRIPKDIKL